MLKPPTHSESQQFKRMPADAADQGWHAKNKKIQLYFAVGLIMLWALVYLAVKLNVIHSL